MTIIEVMKFQSDTYEAIDKISGQLVILHKAGDPGAAKKEYSLMVLTMIYNLLDTVIQGISFPQYITVPTDEELGYMRELMSVVSTSGL